MESGNLKMRKLGVSDLMSLEQYARERAAFRARVIDHKKTTHLAVGPNCTWCFEDRLTMQYQVQEMLRAERIFEPEGLPRSWRSYNPLIPDGSNWKVTLLIEYHGPSRAAHGARALEGSRTAAGSRSRVTQRVCAIADEDLERENEEKTSAVHFLRFELDPTMRAAAQGGRGVSLGVDHEHYRHAIGHVPDAVRVPWSPISTIPPQCADSEVAPDGRTCRARAAVVLYNRARSFSRPK